LLLLSESESTGKKTGGTVVSLGTREQGLNQMGIWPRSAVEGEERRSALYGQKGGESGLGCSEGRENTYLTGRQSLRNRTRWS